MTDAVEYQYVGKPARRVDAGAKLDGAAIYTGDFTVPGMLHAAAVYGRVPHGRLLGVDRTEALAVPGVIAVVTADDIPGANQIGAVIQDQPLLASGRVRFWGDRVALVAADTPEAARRAASLVRLRLEPLPAVFDVKDALREGAVLLHGSSGNLVARHRLLRGDVERGFAEAEWVFEEEFRTSWQEHVYLETQASLAFREGSGIVIRGAIQCPYHAREKVAAVLGIPPENVAIQVAAIGGGFGGKQDYPNEIAACAAVLAWVTSRPVRYVMGRTEDMQVTSKRHPSVTTFRMGVRRDGSIAAADIGVLLDAGAYAAMSKIVLWRNYSVTPGPYRIDNVRVDARAVYTNNVPTSAFRGFGHPQALFGHESMMDVVADRLGIDRLEFRRRNMLRRGDINASGQLMTEDYRLPECLDEAVRMSGWGRRRAEHTAWKTQHPERPRGLGISLMQFGCNLGAVDGALDHSAAVLEIDAAGMLDLRVGLVEMGQGSLTVLSQIAAETIGLPISRIRAWLPDTSKVPDSGPSAASRVTMMGGHAVRQAAARMRDRLLAGAAELSGIRKEDLALVQGVFVTGGRPVAGFEDVCRGLCAGPPVAEVARYDNQYGPWDPETGQGDAYVAWTHAAQVAEVEVDRLTGRVRVLRVWSAYDIGRPVNSVLCEGQVEGGVAMGIGYALMEDLRTAPDGEILTKNYSTYIIPTALDMPLSIETKFVEGDCPRGPYGAKSLGEPSFVPTVGSIVGAIHDALGVRPHSVPVTPERILEMEEGRKA
jgi:CO/xanthine dehydrogenase Mo-binding subunit